MPDRSLDRAIYGLSRRQHGVFHRRQAVRIGFTRSMIRRREESGRWVRLVVEGDGRDWHTRVADFERDRWRDATALRTATPPSG